MRRPIAPLAALVAVGLALAACTGTSSRFTYPPAGVTPPPAGAVAGGTAQDVIRALAAAGLTSSVADRPVRPPEGPAFAGAPRLVIQAKLPDDPDHGFIVVYEFASPADATAAAADQAAYVASPIGKSQFTVDAHLVLRTEGATAVFFSWSPGGAADAAQAQVEQAVGTIGMPVTIPR